MLKNRIWVAMLVIALMVLSTVNVTQAQYAANNSGKLPESDDEKAVYQIYQQGLAADRLFGQKRWDDLIQFLESNADALNKEFHRNSDVQFYGIPIRPTDFATIRRYIGDSDFKEGSVKAMSYADFLKSVTYHLYELAGKSYRDDEHVANDAYREIRDISLPVSDDKWVDAIKTLELNILKLETIFARKPALRRGLLDQYAENLTGEMALKEGRDKLAEAIPEWQRVQVKLAAREQNAVAEKKKAALSEVASDIESIIAELDKMLKAVRADGFIDASKAHIMIAGQAQYLEDRTKFYRQLYAQQNSQMPPDILAPLEAKFNEVQRAIDENAPRFTFPTGLAHDPVVEAIIRRGIMTAIPGARVLEIGFSDAAWIISRNNLGLFTDRYKRGFVLYQMSGESLARLYKIIYSEDYAGGGTFARANGVRNWDYLRWQKAR
ncbi:MAG: hypothetical protein QOJ64_2076 [Acidobacteriota bacterium]|jgi:hypothetical protein|nr:hypothetical protein [Acidobacteriota bacterium]